MNKPSLILSLYVNLWFDWLRVSSFYFNLTKQKGHHFQRIQGAREKQIKRRTMKFKAGEVERSWLLKRLHCAPAEELVGWSNGVWTARPHTFLMSGLATVRDNLAPLAQLLSTDCSPAGLESYQPEHGNLYVSSSRNITHTASCHHKAPLSLQEAQSQHSGEQHRVHDQTFSH